MLVPAPHDQADVSAIDHLKSNSIQLHRLSLSFSLSLSLSRQGICLPLIFTEQRTTKKAPAPFKPTLPTNLSLSIGQSSGTMLEGEQQQQPKSRGGNRGGRGAYRGRGYRGKKSSQQSRHQDCVLNTSDTNTENKSQPPATQVKYASPFERFVENPKIANAFEASCRHITRCRERSRLFHLPLGHTATATAEDTRDEGPAPLSTTNDKNTMAVVVVERTIGGFDDVVYKKHREVWERLPRGNARVFIPAGDVAEPSAPPTAGEATGQSADGGYRLVGAVNGLRKFGYGDSSYGYPEAVKSVIAVEKANGECGHIAAFCLPPAADSDGQATGTTSSTQNRFWIIGSKNVHIVLDYVVSEAQLAYYRHLGQRYTYAVKIAELWHRCICGDAQQTANDIATNEWSITAEKLLSFHETLATKRWTACFEAIFDDSQHLVDYNGVNTMCFYAVTENRRAFENAPTAAETAFSASDGLCLDVLAAKEICTTAGLPFCRHSDRVEYPSAAYTALVEDIARRTNSEGCVMYGTDSGDPAVAKVVCLWKEKSYPYVMERATREAITQRKMAGKELVNRLSKKLNLQGPHLRSYFSDWEAVRLPLLVKFAAWLQLRRHLTPHMSRDALFPLRNQWLTLQRQFQSELAADAELGGFCDQYQPDGEVWGGDARALDVVKFTGPQGSGKSTLSRALFILLRRAGYQPRWLNQDEAGNREKFLAGIRNATHQSSGVTHLLIDKMNLDAQMNADYAMLPLTVTVAFLHDDGAEALYETCIDRVLRRGAGHRTIRLVEGGDGVAAVQEREKQVQNIRSFVRRAVRNYALPDDEAETMLTLDVETPLEEMVRLLWQRLNASGIHSLPAIADEEIADALRMSQRYEELLCSLPIAPIYACISISDPSAMLSLVPKNFVIGQVVQKSFHLTTKFFGGETDPVYFVELAERLNQSVELTLEAVYGDNAGVAIVVARDDEKYPCANAVPHITIANRRGVQPKYSNELISPDYPGVMSDRKVVKLPPGTTVTGIFKFC